MRDFIPQLTMTYQAKTAPLNGFKLNTKYKIFNYKYLKFNYIKIYAHTIYVDTYKYCIFVAALNNLCQTKKQILMKTKWTIDPMHSEINFKIRHLVISNVSGSFGKYSAEVETEGDNFETASIHFTADVNSINTGVEQRDGHLKSADFFDTAKYPTIDFVSTSFTKAERKSHDAWCYKTN
jgi:hypothetical protein